LFLLYPFHSGILKRGYLIEFYKVLQQNVLLFSAIILLLFAMKTVQIHSRLFVGTFFIANFLLQYILRIVWKKVILRQIKQSGNKIHVVIVSYRENAKRMIDNLLNSSSLDMYQIDRVMLLDKEKRYTPIEGIKVVYKNDIPELLRTHVVDEVFIGAKAREIKDTGNLVSWFLSMGITCTS